MTKTKALLITSMVVILLAGCSTESKVNTSPLTEGSGYDNSTEFETPIAEEATASEVLEQLDMEITSPEEAIERLLAGNTYYTEANENPSEFRQSDLADLATNGQEPYAVVLTCSDSRVPPEHIFAAGVGDLFVIRTAGNVVDDFELGSIEYGAEHLGAKVVVVMGHTKCGAVSAALSGHADGHIQAIVDDILIGIGDERDSIKAENKNISYNKEKIMESEIIQAMAAGGELIVVEAKYDIDTGKVTFIED